MPYDLTEPLVIGISSRALFNLEEENSIYESEGLRAYEEYQLTHEKVILQKGSAFQLVRAFLNLNKLQTNKRLVEVIITSKNSPNTSLRIFNSIQDYDLDITRAALCGGDEIVPYLKAFKTDLFLSANEDDVKQAIDNDIAAGTILTSPVYDSRKKIEQIRIAFDGDAVLFSAEAERINQHSGLAAFMNSEQEKADIPLSKGPFANFLITLAHIQKMFPEKKSSPIRTALVTSRNAPAHERAIKTLRAWNVHIDEAFFLGGVSKKEILRAFGAHIFFDDQHVHADAASEVVPSAVVPYRDGDNPMN